MCLSLSPAAFPCVVCRSPALLWYVLPTLIKSERNLSLVHPKQLRSCYSPQNRCNSCLVKKEDKVLGPRNVCVPAPSLQQGHTSVSWMLPLGKVGYVF